MGGLARFNDRPVVVIGHEKGNDTRSRIERNFGMARPEGYRKAIRLMDLADRFGLPVITLVDTPGAYPGKGAEERGQAEAIARSTEKCLQIGVPLVSVIIGEGGSGGAVAFATADRIAMLEHSIYSVISPEGCASILWKDAEKMKEAAEALRLTAQDLLALGVVDRIIPEPKGGAQRDKPEAIARVGAAIGRAARRARRQEARRPPQGPPPQVPRPDQHQHRHGDHDDEQRQRQPEPRIVAEPIAARAHDQRVALVADRREEIAAGADRHRHQEGFRPVAERSRRSRRRSAPRPARSRHC